MIMSDIMNARRVFDVMVSARRRRGASSRVAASALAAVTVVAAWLAPVAEGVPGPAFTVPALDLSRALYCPTAPHGARGEPVLLVHGTFVDRHFWDGGYLDALPAAGHPVCALTVPGRELDDMQVSVEYVVAAIRAMSERAGRPIGVIGHSQGGVLTTIALRYWPDLADKVADFVGLASPYVRGTALAAVMCAVPCRAAARQLDPASRLTRALAERPVYRGPSYTTVNSASDELIVPQPAAGRLPGATNITVQDVCPGRSVEHVQLAFDAVGFALALDALEHPGAADPGRLRRGVCSHEFLPGMQPTAVADVYRQAALAFPAIFTDPVAAEPRLRCYLDPACSKPRLRPRVQGSALTRTGGGVRIRGRLELPTGAIERCAGTVRVLVGRYHRAVPVGANCRFGTAVRARTASRRVRLRFLGTAELLPAAVLLRLAPRG